MKLTVVALILLAFFFSGCGNNTNPGNVVKLVPSQAVYVANTGSSSISVFDFPYNTSGSAPSLSSTLAPASGSPFPVNAPPTFLAGEVLSSQSPIQPTDNTLFVASAPAKTIAVYNLDPATGALKNLVTTLSMPYTPKALIIGANNAIYVADAEGYVSAYTYSNGALTEIPGSPFPAGTDPVAIAQSSTGNIYVANAGSNNISGYNVDVSGVLTPLPASPYPAGTSPSSIELSSPYNAQWGSDFIVVTDGGSNSVSVYSENADGSLAQVPGSPFATGAKPSSSTSIRTSTAAYNFVFVTNFGSNTISGYTLDPATGLLSPMSSSPFPVETGPVSIASDSFWAPYVYVASQSSNELSVYWVPFAGPSGFSPVPGSPFPTGTSPDQVLFLGPPVPPL